MEKKRKVTDDFFVSTQIDVDELKHLADDGIRMIINNRPDGESEDQPSSAEIEAAAKSLGMNYAYIPVVPGKLDDTHVEKFDVALQNSSGPILAFCKSGTRAIYLWAMHQSAHAPTEELREKAQRAGFDIEPILKKIQPKN